MRQTVITTARLLLRPFQAADAPAFYAYARDPQVGFSAGWRPHQSLEETRQIIRTRMSGPHIFALLERESQVLVGSAGFTGRSGVPHISDEIGYSLRPDRWGRGYASEAVRALLEYGFMTRGLGEIWASYYDGNSASGRVLEKCGFSPLFSQQLRDDLGEHLVHFCRITDTEWRGV